VAILFMEMWFRLREVRENSKTRQAGIRENAFFLLSWSPYDLVISDG
jgi:hypothetical protein